MSIILVLYILIILTMGIYDNKIVELEEYIFLMNNNEMFIKTLKDLFNSNTKVDDTIIQNLINIIHGDSEFIELEEHLIDLKDKIQSISYNIDNLASFIAGFKNPIFFIKGLLPILGLSKRVNDRGTNIYDIYSLVLEKYKSMN